VRLRLTWSGRKGEGDHELILHCTRSLDEKMPEVLVKVGHAWMIGCFGLGL